jgi:hypothetical protein
MFINIVLWLTKNPRKTARFQPVEFSRIHPQTFPMKPKKATASSPSVVVPRITEETYQFVEGNKAVRLATGDLVDAQPIKDAARRTWQKVTLTP